MSTLPFLLSVADELDNINSQSYMDDFGLGFHPHRQFYRTPTIQLSLPAGTDWMQQDTRHQPASRHRSYRYWDESLNQNLQAANEYEEPEEEKEEQEGDKSKDKDQNCPKGENDSASSSASARRARKFVSALNSNGNEKHGEHQHKPPPPINTSISLYNVSKKCNKNHFRHLKSANVATTSTCPSTATSTPISAPSISTSTRTSTLASTPTSASSSSSSYTIASTSTMSTPIQMATTTSSRTRTDHSTSKSNAAITTDSTNTSIRVKDSRFSLSGYRAHTKCLQGNNSSASSSSSSDESMQKVFSSIEFLTCFLLKKSRAAKSTISPPSGSTSLPSSSHNASEGKKL